MRRGVQIFRIVLMAAIAVLLVVQAVRLATAPTAGGGLVVLALAGSLAALGLDFRRRHRERRRNSNKKNV